MSRSARFGQLQFVTWLEQSARHQPRTLSWLSTRPQKPLHAMSRFGPPSPSIGPPSSRWAGIHLASTKGAWNSPPARV